MNKLKTKGIAAATVAIAAIAGGTAAVAANGGDQGEAPITGAALTRASAAALGQVGQGRVTETEVGGDEAYYEVEVTLADGSQVDVRLNRNFKVIGQKADREAPGTQDGPRG